MENLFFYTNIWIAQDIVGISSKYTPLWYLDCGTLIVVPQQELYAIDPEQRKGHNDSIFTLHVPPNQDWHRDMHTNPNGEK